MAHEFSLHQVVRLSLATPLAQLSPNGLYEVVCLMPQNVAGAYSYRIKSSAGERVAAEHDLCCEPAVTT